jgi:hypothetical protein
MTIPNRRSSTTPLNPPDVPVEDKRRELAGTRPPDAQAAYIDQSDVESHAAASSTAIYEGALPAGDEELLLSEAALAESEALESLAAIGPDGLVEGERQRLLAGIDEAEQLAGSEEFLPVVSYITPGDMELLNELELRAEETDDVMEAVAEGYTYVPPIDPPIVPGGWANAEIASGLGVSALDEPYDEAHHSSFLPSDDEVSARVREALRADSSTTAYADRIAIATRGGVVTLRGVVDDLIDNDNLLAVAAYVEGVQEVVDALRVRAM